MTLADREYQRTHRNDPEPPHLPPKSNGWIWVMVGIAILILLVWAFHWFR
jgi:hypothetical protein